MATEPPLPGHEKVDGWLCDGKAAYESDLDGPSFYPKQPTAPRKDQCVEVGVLQSALAPQAFAASYAHQERRALCEQGLRGPAPAALCYNATGLQEGGPHDGYACFNMRYIL